MIRSEVVDVVDDTECQGLIRDFNRAELVRDRASRALRRGDLAECGLIQLGQLP
jgi:hypothetical protein